MNFWTDYPEIQNELIKVEEYMKKAVVSRNSELTRIAQDLIEAGGKRLRPAFVILSAKAGKKYKEEIVIPLAASIELIHTATLVHDDIVDEATYRRGKESVHSKWGRDMAIYTGDYLLTKSFLLLSKDTSFNRINYVAKLMKAICEGEIDQYANRYYTPNVFQYLKNIYRKTALLFGMSLGIGAHESKATKEIGRAMTLFGTYFGMAFQIYDDLLDYTSSENLIGKPVGNDLKQGYYTLPLIFALEDASYGKDIRKLLDMKEEISEEELIELYGLVRKTQAIEQAKELLDKFKYKAVQVLQPITNKEIKSVLLHLNERLS